MRSRSRGPSARCVSGACLFRPVPFVDLACFDPVCFLLPFGPRGTRYAAVIISRRAYDLVARPSDYSQATVRPGNSLPGIAQVKRRARLEGLARIQLLDRSPRGRADLRAQRRLPDQLIDYCQRLF